MQDLQLIGVHEDGEHLLLSGSDDARFRMPVDEALRAAIRRDRPPLGQGPIEVDGGLRPRDVQAMIRAGASTDEAAKRAGWSIEKVHRFEGPILAERAHVADLAQKVRLRGRSGASAGSNSHSGTSHHSNTSQHHSNTSQHSSTSAADGVPTLSTRVAERLKGRGVEVTDANWDAWRPEGGRWTVVLTFAAGGRQRQASWHFDLADRTVSAIDDEARWLSEEVQAANGPIPAAARTSTVYDVEAEGGLRSKARFEHQDGPVDLMTAMRKRSTVRGRRKPGGHRGSPPATAQETQVPSSGDQANEHSPQGHAEQALLVEHSPQVEHSPRVEQAPPVEQALPLEGMAFDPGTTSAPTGMHGPPDPSGDGKHQEHEDGPESATAAVIELANEGTAHGDIRGENIRGEDARDQDTKDEAPPAPREVARKTGRPSVPAWEEIMFGSRPGVRRSSS